MSNVVVTVTPTVMDGTVVRWYASLEAEERNVELVSASRNGVMVRHKLDGWQDVINAAGAAHDTLRRDRNADMRHLATHRRQGLFGPLVPVGLDGEESKP